MNSRRRPGRPLHQASHLHLESLECRVVLAASVGLDRAGLLRITGSPSDDGVVVSVQRSNVVVNQPDAPARAFALGRVRSIAFTGLGGNDSFINNTAIRSVADGGAGNDTLVGGSSVDVLRGGDDADTLRGNGSADTIDGGAGDDHVFGGAGNDTLLGDDGNDDIHGDDGNDRIVGGRGDDFVEGGRGNDEATGGDGDDALYGNEGNDRLFGENDDDLLSGNDGNDELFGQDGDDSLDGDAGDDRLYGGSGRDEDLDDDDRLEDEDEDEDEEEHENENDAPASVLPITFSSDGLAQLQGTSLNHSDKKFYVFTATVSGTLAVAVVRVDGQPYADVEVEQAGAAGHLLELEPFEGRPSTGTVPVVAGRAYVVRVRSPLNTAVSYRVDLAFTATPA